MKKTLIFVTILMLSFSCSLKKDKIQDPEVMCTNDHLLSSIKESITYNYNDWEVYDSMIVNRKVNIELVPITSKDSSGIDYIIISNLDNFTYQIPKNQKKMLKEQINMLKLYKDRVKINKIINRLDN